MEYFGIFGQRGIGRSYDLNSFVGLLLVGVRYSGETLLVITLGVQNDGAFIGSSNLLLPVTIYEWFCSVVTRLW